MHNELNLLLEKIKNPAKRNWILMVPNSLGETVTVCGLSDSFLAKYGHGITLAIPESHSFIPKCYPNTFERIVCMPLETMRQFSATGFIPQNFFNIDFPINTWPAQNGDGRSLALHELWVSSSGKSGLNFIDLYRYNLRLDWSAKFTAAKLPEKSYIDADNIIKKLNIKHKKTVVFFIGTNTNKPAPTYLWEQLAKSYHEQGFDILINKYGAMFFPQDLSIPYAKVVDIPLDMAIPICEYAGHMVSGSTGFAFFAIASQADCNMNILLTHEICYDYSRGLFKDSNYMAGSNQLAIPELTSNIKKIREWSVPKIYNKSTLDEIAYGIVFDIDNKHTISRDTQANSTHENHVAPVKTINYGESYRAT